MSYYCDNCGKERAHRPGEWCSECQEQAHFEYEAWQDKWFNDSRLCQKCNNAWGPDPIDTCGAYNMPLWMVKRKNKCKRFKEIDWSLEPETYY